MKNSDSTIIQKEPSCGGVNVWEQVISDMRLRDEFGKAKYGTCLQAFNGRNALIDAYQEALDLVVYLKQKILEEGYMKEHNLNQCKGSDGSGYGDSLCESYDAEIRSKVIMGVTLYWVACDECDRMTEAFDNIDEAVSSWNELNYEEPYVPKERTEAQKKVDSWHICRSPFTSLLESLSKNK